MDNNMVVKEYNKGALYWITGLSGAGKTTIGNRLYYEFKKKRDDVILLDGDVLRRLFEDDYDDIYSDSSRRARAQKYAKICKMLTDQGFIVICCTIAMYDSVRNWNRENNKRYVEVFLDVPLEVLEKRDQKGLYSRKTEGSLKSGLAGVDLKIELPTNPDIRICNDGRYSVKECVDFILDYQSVFKSDFDRDTQYWNEFYANAKDISMPSLFAKEAIKKMDKGGNLLELGCGNGRDSIFFASKGLNVTAIDSSDKAIEMLQNMDIPGNIFFVCDDFVTAAALYTGQYEYCYSRFSLHAINEQQESEVIENVYNVLKDGGSFFVEVRSVNDELYGKGEQVGRNAFHYQGHFRRFVEKSELENKMKSAGFVVEYSEESRGFAPFGEDDPQVIRMILRKTRHTI